MKKMNPWDEEKKDALFEELQELGVSLFLREQLKLSMAVDRSLTFCCVVNDYVNNFHSDEATEDKVCVILQQLALIHFKH